MSKKVAPEKVKAFLARHGAPVDNAAVNAAVSDLLTDLFRYRTKLKEAGDTPYRPDARTAELESENQRLESEVDRISALLPAQGAVVLSADEAKAWEAFKLLGKPEEVKKQLEELPTLRTKVSDVEVSTAAADAAKILGWNGEATTGLVKDKALVVSFVDSKDAQGKDVKVPHVRPASDEKAATVPLADWVQKNAAYLAPALSAKGGTPATQPGTTDVIPFTPLSGGGTPPTTGDVVADHAKRAQDARDARPNPFAPRKAAATT